MLAADEGTEGVDFEEAADVVGQDGFEWRGGPHGGAINEGIKAAEVAADAIDHGAGGVLVAEVGAERGGGVAGLGELGDQFLCAIERCVGVDGDGVAAAGEFADDGCADADRAAGDEGDRRNQYVAHLNECGPKTSRKGARREEYC